MRAREIAPQVLLCSLLPMAVPVFAATESIEFVAEHIPEIAMDNRYATLPLWLAGDRPRSSEFRFAATASYARSSADGLTLDGPMLSLAVDRELSKSWHFVLLGFFDHLGFSSSGVDRRPLAVSFAGNVPLALPATGDFTQLTGTASHTGLGLAFRHATRRALLRQYEWTAGLMVEQMALREYSLRYRLVDGPDAGATGLLDYSATYTFATPFAGIAWPRVFGAWRTRPHLQIAMPLPRRGVIGRIEGDSFTVAGDTADSNDRPFGDPSLTLGWDVTYRPWNLTADIGSTVTQATLERYIHEGVGRNWLLSLTWEH